MFVLNLLLDVTSMQWPGYNPHTRVLDMPAAVVGGARALTHADLLDMVCGTVLDWMVTISVRLLLPTYRSLSPVLIVAVHRTRDTSRVASRVGL